VRRATAGLLRVRLGGMRRRLVPALLIPLLALSVALLHLAALHTFSVAAIEGSFPTPPENSPADPTPATRTFTTPVNSVLTSNPGESFSAFVARLPANTEGALLAGTYDIGDFGAFKAGQTLEPVQNSDGTYAKVTLRGTLNVDVNNVTLHDLFLAGHTPGKCKKKHKRKKHHAAAAKKHKKHKKKCHRKKVNFDKVVQVEGVSNLTLDHLDITSDPPYQQHPGEGILWIGTPSNLQITNNKIHHIGADGKYDHGIYGAGSTVGGSSIRGNWIYDNAAMGIQLYPKASNMDVSYNVVDGNGALDACPAAPCPPSTTNGRGIILYRNATNNVLHNDIVSVFGGMAYGYTPVYCNVAGNVVKDSLIYRAHGGLPTEGITATNIITANPMYVDRANHDYRLLPGSPAAVLMGAYAQAVPGPRV
jgi:hypothetical protein